MLDRGNEKRRAAHGRLAGEPRQCCPPRSDAPGACALGLAAAARRGNPSPKDGSAIAPLRRWPPLTGPPWGLWHLFINRNGDVEVATRGRPPGKVFFEPRSVVPQALRPAPRTVLGPAPTPTTSLLFK